MLEHIIKKLIDGYMEVNREFEESTQDYLKCIGLTNEEIEYVLTHIELKYL